MKTRKSVLTIISFVLVLTVAVNFAGCAGQVSAAELTAGITANKVSGKSADDKFTKTQFEFYAKLYFSFIGAACFSNDRNRSKRRNKVSDGKAAGRHNTLG